MIDTVGEFVKPVPSRTPRYFAEKWRVETPWFLLEVLPSTSRTQSNHIFACLWAYVKLESLHLKTKMNYFAMNGKSLPSRTCQCLPRTTNP